MICYQVISPTSSSGFSSDFGGTSESGSWRTEAEGSPVLTSGETRELRPIGLPPQHPSHAAQPAATWVCSGSSIKRIFRVSECGCEILIADDH